VPTLYFLVFWSCIAPRSIFPAELHLLAFSKYGGLYFGPRKGEAGERGRELLRLREISGSSRSRRFDNGCRFFVKLIIQAMAGPVGLFQKGAFTGRTPYFFAWNFLEVVNESKRQGQVVQ
jgi:hypothetical protein